MKTRIKMYFGMNPFTTSSKLMPLYKLQVKKWVLLPRKTIAEGITKQEAIDMQKLIKEELTDMNKKSQEEAKHFNQKELLITNRTSQARKKARKVMAYFVEQHIVRGRTQKDIAKELGISQSTLSIEYNKWIAQRLKDQQSQKVQQNDLFYTK